MSNITKSLQVALLALCLLATNATFLHAQEETVALVTAKRSDNRKMVIQVDELARFPGCESYLLSKEEKILCAEQKLKAYIADNLNYPEIAKNADFKPRMVKLDLMVEADGRVNSPRVLDPGIKEYDLSAQSVFVKMAQDNILWVPSVFQEQPKGVPISVTVHFDWEGRNKAYPPTAYGDDIFELVDEVPAFASCQQQGKKDELIRDCTFEYMDNFFTHNMSYPIDALKVGLEGDVHVEFVVGKDGKVHNLQLKNDLGLGCGEEVSRLFDLMNEKNIGWIPGEEDGQKVNVLMKTTVHFKIPASKKAKNHLAEMDAKPVFVTERVGFEEFLTTYLKYPVNEDVNPCSFGVIDVKFKVNQQTGNITIASMTDYNNLGKEFKTAATDFLSETYSEWKVGYPNLDNETQYFLSLPFAPTANCPDVPKGYKDMLYSAIEGAAIAENKSKLNDGLDLLDKALRLYPSDNKMRFLRGTALYKNGREVEGCVDLSFVNKQNKDIAVPKTCK